MEGDESRGGPIVGQFVGRDPWSSERHCELVGPGSIELLGHGIHVRATWRPLIRRTGVVLGGVITSSLSALILADVGAAAAAAAMAVPAAAAVAGWRRWCRESPFDQVIPWGYVGAGGVSEGLLVFSLPGPQEGVARFRVPGYGIKELRPVAQAIKARGR